jgi:hypothetical protein
MRFGITIVAVATLALAAGLCVAGPLFYPARQSVTVPIEVIVPRELHGWMVRTLPIGETEELQNEIHKVLRYDAAVFRVYRRGDIEVGVYAAHWTPGKASLSDVGAHTPDTCWIVAGWNRSARSHGDGLCVGTRALLPPEVATFEKNSVVQHVMFWHLAGGRPIVFDQFGWDVRWMARIKRGLSFVRDAVRFGLDQRCDQCFVRISSNRPIAALLRDPDFEALLEHLAPLGIFADASRHGR